MRYWKRLNPDNTARTIECYSHALDIEGAVEIDPVEYAALEAKLTTPVRNFLNEIDQLKARIQTDPTIDWKAKWLAADNTAKKLEVVKELLKLA